MKLPNTRKYPLNRQYLICISLILVVSVGSYFFSPLVGYRVIALILLMTVSLIAMFFEMAPVITASILSAIIWNFFFIPPLFTFHIDASEDTLLFLLYFFIAFINTVLTIKIREAEKKARDKVEQDKLIKLYGTLFNSLSHELRTPISMIIGAIDTLKENEASLNKGDKDELLGVIDKAAFRLNREVDNLLNMSRLESGTFHLNLDWCDINEVIFTVIQKLVGINRENIRFTPDDNLPLFKLDAGIIGLVVYNLIHNAIIHNDPDIVIGVEALYQDGCCVITVSDDGKGFPEEEIPHVFEKFYRLPVNRAGGSGLGLSIVKGFVEAHHGTVHLNNLVKRGSIFTLRIPSDVSYINNLKNE